jgi:hypothetical protein
MLKYSEVVVKIFVTTSNIYKKYLKKLLNFENTP